MLMSVFIFNEPVNWVAFFLLAWVYTYVILYRLGLGGMLACICSSNLN